MIRAASGRCCNIYTGECVDDVLKANSPTSTTAVWARRTEPALIGLLRVSEAAWSRSVPSLRANCTGRFESLAEGEPCTADVFTPECGLWVPTGVLYCPANMSVDGVFMSTLSTLLGGQPVVFVDGTSTIPTVEEMRQYAAVFLWVNYPLADNVLMGNNLADYVDMGGRVVLGQWCFPTAGNYLAGRIMNDPAYCPVASAAGWGSGSYMGDGEQCATMGVSTLTTDYLDMITGLQPNAGWDGHIGTSYAAIWNAPMSVWYTPGNLGGSYQSGDWAQLTYNAIVCQNVPGPCCNLYTAECVDDLMPLDCFAYGAGWKWNPSGTCATLVPPCGDPGCCCERPEEGVVKDPVESLRANCEGAPVRRSRRVCRRGLG